jgi:UDP-N-acetylmuramoyl-L-alanyl-D-glutamate--2,6-diaminopimelate ligase
MDLCDVIEGVEVIRVSGPADPQILAVAYDSRKVTPGSLFFALPGEKVDGIRFADQAMARCAVAVAAPVARPRDTRGDVAWIELTPGKERRALAQSAANFYGRPATALRLVGVTGTNGKTTTAHLVDSILRVAGCTSGLVATTGYRTPKSATRAASTPCSRRAPMHSRWIDCGAAILRSRFLRI